MKRVEAAGGVLHRKGTSTSEKEVLLIYRRGVWDLPKGKVEEGETVEECAVREVSEEIGSSPPLLEFFLTKTQHSYSEQGEIVNKITHWYSMQLSNETDSLTPQKEERIEEIRWLPLSEAKEIVGYRNLVKVLQAFEQVVEL
ncbi:MAG: NUDIX domain-containing protein [Balneolaceae bacterium]